MHQAPPSPQEHSRITERYGRYKTGFIAAVAVTVLLGLGMLASEMPFLAIIFSALGGYGSYLLFAEMQKSQKDLAGGIVTIFQGPIEKKEVTKNQFEMKSYLLFVDGENHRVKYEFYSGVELGDTVELHYTPHGRLSTFSRLLYRKGSEPLHDHGAAEPLCEVCQTPIDPASGLCPRCYWEEHTSPE